jgi:hypothetical protein
VTNVTDESSLFSLSDISAIAPSNRKGPPQQAVPSLGQPTSASATTGTTAGRVSSGAVTSGRPSTTTSNGGASAPSTVRARTSSGRPVRSTVPRAAEEPARKVRRLDSACLDPAVLDPAVRVLLMQQIAVLAKENGDLLSQMECQRLDLQKAQQEAASLSSKLDSALERVQQLERSAEEAKELKGLVQSLNQEVRAMRSQVDKNEGRLASIESRPATNSSTAAPPLPAASSFGSAPPPKSSTDTPPPPPAATPFGSSASTSTTATASSAFGGFGGGGEKSERPRVVSF